jgi:hypothetical protein
MSTSIAQSGYRVIQEEGSNLPSRNTLDFQGAGVTAADVAGKTVVTIPGSGTYAPVYGSFYDTTTQSVASGSVKAMELNTTDISGGITIANNTLGRPTRITVNASGVYNLEFSAQLNRSTGGNARQIDIWIRKNELDIPWSNTGVTMQANDGKIVASWNFYVSLTAGQYVEIMWSQDDAIDILAVAAAPNWPATPSVIATMHKVN